MTSGILKFNYFVSTLLLIFQYILYFVIVIWLVMLQVFLKYKKNTFAMAYIFYVF